MNFTKKCKKAVVIVMTAIMLAGNFAVPAMAHGHHGSGHTSYVSHHSSQRRSKGVYCSYHEKYHKKKSNCRRYCKKHKTTHWNGKRHHVKRHH